MRSNLRGRVPGFLLLMALVASPALASAQQQTGAITGTVTDRHTGQPIAGAQITVTNTRFGGTSNETGRFLITGVPAGTYAVVVQFLGFSEIRRNNVQVEAGGTATVAAAMEQAVLPLQELVVSGMTDPTAGVKLPFSVSKVTTDQLQVPTTNSALASIQGKVAGASIIRASGQPGEGVYIMFRSPTAFEEDNTPLIVVDGVVLSRSFGGTTSDIESLDIESIEVIKGAAAASLYGSRAAAGVISITTNRGRNAPQGITRVTSRTEFGVSRIGRQIPLTSKHHYRITADGSSFANTAGEPVTWGGRTRAAPAFQDRDYPVQTYDNISAVYQPGQFLTQNFTISQNTANTTFLVSLNRYDEEGALTNNEGYWRNTGRISIDHRIGDKFSVALVGSHARTWQDGSSGNPYTAALTYAPIVDLTKKDANGQYLQLPDSTVLTENPLWRQGSRDNFEERARTLGSLNARFSPLRWITLDAQLSYDRSDIKSQVYVPKGTPTEVDEDVPSDGQLELDHRGTDTYNGSMAATLIRQFGDLNARLTGRALFEKEESEYIYAAGEDFLVRGVRDLSAATTLDDISSSTRDIRSNGYLANLGFDFRDRYIADFLVRRDGSSLFGPLERWHTYGRVALAWRMAQESWWPFESINEFKPRYSMGTAGGRPAFGEIYESWNTSRTSGLSRVTAGNAALRPQFTREQEFGLDIIGIDNRVSLELVYARQTSRDQIIALPVPVITGFNSILGNGAEIKGHTYEATLQARVVNRPNTTWQVSLVADRSRNEITEWERACFYGSNAGRGHEFTCAGASAGDFWIQTHLRDAADLPTAVRDRASEFQINDEGYLVWVGAGNDYTEGVSKSLWGTSMAAGGRTFYWGEPIVLMDDNNIAILPYRGTSLADLNYGFTSNIRYKNLTLYGVLRGQLGGKVYSDSRQYLYNQLRHGDLDQTGKPEGLKKPVDYYQRALYNGNNWTDVFLEDATHLKISEISLRYRFTRNQLQKVMGTIAPADLSIGVNGRNLFTFTGYRGFDPERGTQLSRVEGIGYPHLRNFTATLDITF